MHLVKAFFIHTIGENPFKFNNINWKNIIHICQEVFICYLLWEVASLSGNVFRKYIEQISPFIIILGPIASPLSSILGNVFGCVFIVYIYRQKKRMILYILAIFSAPLLLFMVIPMAYRDVFVVFLKNLMIGGFGWLIVLIHKMEPKQDVISSEYWCFNITFPLITVWTLVVSALMIISSYLCNDQITTQSSRFFFGLINNPFIWSIFFIKIVIVGPFFEELIYKGLLFRALRKTIGFPETTIITAAIFALGHFDDFRRIVPTFIMGVATAFLYERYQSIAPCFILHAAVNLLNWVILDILYFLRSVF